MKTAKLLAVALGLVAGVAANAQPINVTLDGTKIDFPGQEPIMMNSRVMVPLRGIFEEFGADVHWDNSARTVRVSDHDREITMHIGSKVAIINGNHVTLDAPATVVNGRTMVPLRFVSENVRRDVYWNAKIRTVEIDSIAAVTKVNRAGDNTPIGASFTRIPLTARRNDSA